MESIDYKRLGDYIKPYSEKNIGLKVRLPQGICNNKYFQNPRQVSQDSENDQIVRKGQFAYNKATTRNGEKISIAYREGPDCTVSSAYQVFYIENENLLNPYYLWLWFKRPQFDRYARFKSHGSAHEFFTWEEMCNVMLPVPPIAEQRKIVEQYQTIERRIKNNEALIQKLEATAQALYHHTFVEGIDKENLPEGWRMGYLRDIATFKVGGDKPDLFSEIKTQEYRFPIYSNGIDNEGLFGYTNKSSVNEDSITISARGNVGTCFLRRQPYFGIVRLISVIPQEKKLLYYLFFALITQKLQGDGSAQAQITVPQLVNLEVMIPNSKVTSSFYNKSNKLYNHMDILKKENSHLQSMLSHLTSNLS